MKQIGYFAAAIALFVASGFAAYFIRDTQPNPFTIWLFFVSMGSLIAAVISVFKGVES